jgi:DNA-binding response OmpR family regulator
MTKEIQTLQQALERITDLEIEVKYWKGELGLMREENLYAQLRKRYGMTLNEAWFCVVLYRRRGQAVRSSFLYDNRPNVVTDTNLSLQDVKVTICSLRKRMPEGSIETHWGLGYAMTPVGIAFMDDAVKRIENGEGPGQNTPATEKT